MLSSPSTHSLKSVHDRALTERHGLIYYLGWALVFVVLAWAWNGAEIRPLGLINDSQNMATYAKDFFPPDFKDWKLYVKEMLVTIQIAIWGYFAGNCFCRSIWFVELIKHCEAMGISTR